MTMDDLEPDTNEGHDEQDLRNEKLVSQLAELYNENTLLRERVRRLENEVRRNSKRT